MNDFVTLPSGRIIKIQHVEFNSSTYRFWYGVFDVTDSLSRAQKATFRNYDPYVDNGRMSDANQISKGRTPQEAKSVISTFFSGVGSDLASVGTRLRAFYGIGVENADKTSGLMKLAVTGLILYAVFKYFTRAK